MRWQSPCAAVAAALATCAAAAAPSDDSLRAELQKLIQRVEKLERENQALREAQAEADKALASDRLSEKEPELITRLKAVEFQTLEMRKQAQQIEALEGVSVGASLTAVVQRVNAGGAADGRAQTRPNYRGDVSVSLPGGELGDIEGRLFAHFRIGQGNGVALRPAFTSTTNTTAFQTSGEADDATALLAQAWYQLTVPLPRERAGQPSRAQIELNVGKIDPFVFFDQNAAADDESTRFLNNAFVHNPLLDSGGDVGADAYGFSPGLRLAYVAQPSRSLRWGASLGVFGAGEGARFAGSLGKPFVIAQLEVSGPVAPGQPGSYRLYAWHNGQGSDASGAVARHSGIGFSADQRVGDSLLLFARYGHQLDGEPRFDRALTLGGELGGNAWGRAADGLGMALGGLRSAAAYRAASGAQGYERIAELYYRFQLNSKLQLTPDVQWVQRAAGDPAAPTLRAFGLRARLAL